MGGWSKSLGECAQPQVLRNDIMYWIFMFRDSSELEMMLHLEKELFWHQALERWPWGRNQMLDMMERIQEIILTLDI